MEELIKKIQEQLDNNWPVEAEDIQALIDYVISSRRDLKLCIDAIEGITSQSDFASDVPNYINKKYSLNGGEPRAVDVSSSLLRNLVDHKYVMNDIQFEWLKNRELHERLKDNSGIRSSQISALVMYLIKKGVL